jgi:hypothetical protein
MKYMLLCSSCPNKVFTNGNDLDDFAEVPSAPIPLKGTGRHKGVVEQRKKLKCPLCGHILRIVKLTPDEPKPKTEGPDLP